ncbi:MAG: M81 family metallopeptidase [Candidatus Latescibacterota bacterium]|nr:M81 family metallopeptidase [Candidatus Latescibacterota bacterium]
MNPSASTQPRIAVGSILTECNQFGGSPIDLSWFARYNLHWGNEMLATDTGVVGGALSALRQRQADIRPLLAASTCPGSYITADCYQRLRSELLKRLRAELPLDGVLLLLHGAAVADGVDDVEGDLVRTVRDFVGPEIPVVVTLDLHAHVTANMVEQAHGIVAWETYPHRDSLATGERGARLLLDIVAGDCRPTMAMAKVPVLTGGINGSTDGDGPFARLMRETKALEGRPGVLSSSLFLVHPYLDQPHLGSGALVITDGDAERAEALASDIAGAYWEARHELEPDTYSAEEAVAAGLKVEGIPIVLVEAADCAGGGASGDSVASLKALLALGDEAAASLVPVVDPDAAAKCHRAGVGAEIRLQLGHRLDPQWGEPMTIAGEVHKVTDGKFVYSGGIWDGVEGDMGPTAVLRCGEILVLITTHATYDWADEQWRSVDLDPIHVKFVVAKNPMNFHNVYEDHAAAIYVLDTPGPTPASLKSRALERMPRPYFPADSEIPDLRPVVLSNVGLYA